MGFSSHLLLILLASFSLHAMADFCEIEQPETAGGNHRIAAINFPDGRKVTLVGHNHGDRNEVRALFELEDDANFFPKIRAVINGSNVKTTLQHYREDLEILRKAIREGAEFVGLESPDEQVGSWRNMTKLFHDRMIRHSARTGESDISLISDTSLAMGSAPNYLTLIEPAQFLKLKLVGLEDLELVKADASSVKAYLDERRNLFKLSSDDPVYRAKFVKIDQQMSAETYIQYDPSKPYVDTQIIEEYLAETPAKYKSAMRKYLIANLDFFKHLSARDAVVTERLLALNKSGIHFAGAMHILPTARRLREACLRSLGVANYKSPITLKKSATAER